MDGLDYESDSFGDIVAKDPRYNARAYSLLVAAINSLAEETAAQFPDSVDEDEPLGSHLSGEEILHAFRELALEQFGPLAYTVLTEWGLTCTEDIGEMMFNLADSHRIVREEGDSAEDFVNRYDFKDEFLGPYEA